MRASRFLAALLALGAASVGAAPVTAGSSTAYSADSTSAAGTSFVYSGTLSGTDTFTLSAAGTPCLQYGFDQSGGRVNGILYCTNAAGVIVVAGSSGVGQSSQDGTTTFGSLLLTISGVGTEQLFLPIAANGAGSNTPPTSLTLLPTALSLIGFGAFSVVNPTLTFTVDDTDRSDNAGSFTGSFTVSPRATVAVPEPASLALLGAGLAVGFARRRRRVA